MNSRFAFGILALLISCLATFTARAELVVVASLEWQTCAAEAIVLGTISKMSTTKGPHSVTYEDCVIDVERVLKGDLKEKQLAFTVRQVSGMPTVKPFLETKARVLLFLKRDKSSEEHLQGKWVDRDVPDTWGVLNLSQSPEQAYSKDSKILHNSEEVLEIVDAWAKSPIKHSLMRDVSAELYEKLWGGSAVLILVPAEEKYRAEFMQLAQSKDAYERARGAKVLSKYPGAETEQVLQGLLADESESPSNFSQDEITSVVFRVRAAALQSLKALGKPVPELVLERAPTAEEQRALREKCWTRSFTESLKEGWQISVVDGPLRKLEQRQLAIVVVTCQRGDHQATFTLVPKEWPADELPKSEYLGTDGPNSQGGRHFYFEGKLPADVKEQIVRHFGLEKAEAKGN